MKDLRDIVCTDIVNSITKLNHLKKFYPVYENNSGFFYENNTIYDDIYSIDIRSFNLEFLRYINHFIQSENVNQYINSLNSFDKHKRVVEFGCLFKSISEHNIKLNKYMVSFRNYIFIPFFKHIYNSPKSIQLHRINYDDVEFFSITNNITTDLFIYNKFLNITKINKYDKIIVLNKKDGVYYINNNKIVDIKYTSGWVNIPAYRFFINLVIDFILNKDSHLTELNNKINEYIELASDVDFFGYEDDDISNSYKPGEVIPMAVKYLFVAKVMSKFSILFK